MHINEWKKKKKQMIRSDNVQAFAFDRNGCKTGPILMLALAKSNGAPIIQIGVCCCLMLACHQLKMVVVVVIDVIILYYICLHILVFTSEKNVGFSSSRKS